jgi:hypothetical protein
MKVSEYLTDRIYMDCCPQSYEANSFYMTIKLENGEEHTIYNNEFAPTENFAEDVFSSSLFKEMDERFIDVKEKRFVDDLTKIKTIFGVKIEHIILMIMFFENKMINPKNDDFESIIRKLMDRDETKEEEFNEFDSMSMGLSKLSVKIVSKQIAKEIFEDINGIVENSDLIFRGRENFGMIDILALKNNISKSLKYKKKKWLGDINERI